MISDLSKYKRFFAFGCSFTSYYPPTWADIIASEMPDADYYNFGQGGAGNLLINNRVAQANLKFKFNEDDLVIVMFTTLCREDRYIDGCWRSHGNIYNQHYYNKNFVKNYCDPIGYIVRDLALIEMTQVYLNSLPCTTVFLSLADLTEQSNLLNETEEIAKTVDFDNDYTLGKVKEIYPNMNFPYVMELDSFGYHGLSLIDHDGTKRGDGHPLTEDYLNFLLKYNFPISDVGKEYTAEMMRRTKKAKTWAELYDLFPEMSQNKIKSNSAII